jgi:hypothetical protein
MLTYDLLKWAIPTLKKFPRDQRFLLGDRIENHNNIGFRVAHAPACLIIQVLPESDTSRRAGEGMLYIEKLYWLRKNSEFVMPVPDQVRDDGSGIQNLLKLLNSGLRRNDALKKF